MRTRPPCRRTRRVPDVDEFVVRLEVSVGAHPMLGLTMARLAMVALGELGADHVAVHRLEVSVEGPFVTTPEYP